jgi:hypothetical protein
MEECFFFLLKNKIKDEETSDKNKNYAIIRSVAARVVKILENDTKI